MKICLACGLWLGLWGLVVSEVWAAGSITLNPASGTGTSFNVQIEIDTGGDSTIETDVILNYDESVLQVNDVVFGNLYPENVHAVDSVNGTLSTFSYFSTSNPGDNFTGSGVLATVEFTGLSPGESDVTVSCTPSATNDSNMMVQGTAQDILDCQLVENGSYTVTSTGSTGEDSNPTLTPTPTTQSSTVTTAPTLTPTPTRTVTLSPTPTRILEIGSGDQSPTPTPVEELLESGALTPTLTLSVVGVMLLIGSLVLFVW